MSVFGRFGLLVLAGVLLSSQMARADDPTYVGSKKCKKCHLKEYKSWEETTMAKSFEVLKPGIRSEKKEAAGLDPKKDYTKDAECLACHTTGYGKPGGFVDMEKTPDLAGVGCESCHGPGGIYIEEEYMSLKNKHYKREELVAVGMVGEIVKETCAGTCHNNQSPFVGEDYVFDFEAKKDEGIHLILALKYEH